MPGFPRHTQNLGASRRKGRHGALDPEIIAAKIFEDLQSLLAVASPPSPSSLNGAAGSERHGWVNPRG